MAFATIDVTKGITGTIPVANGGTGLASGTTDQFLKFTGSTTLASSAVDTGKILQVQHANFTGSNTAVTTDSLTATEVTDQITPSATGSKVLVVINLSCQMYENSGTHNKYQAAIYRSIGGASYSKVYAGQSNAYGGMGGFGSGTEISSSWPTSLIFTDSPSTTSAVDYKLYLGLNVASAGGNNVTTGASDMERAITLLEIGA
jgi:hypothetical protein